MTPSMAGDVAGHSGNRQMMFVTSCIAIIATALVFSVRGDILGDLKTSFDLSDVEVGWVSTIALWGFLISIFIGGQLLDYIGTKAMLVLAFIGQVLGTVLTIYSTSYTFLLAATLIIGVGNGFVEGATNPLVATIYPDRKTEKLNALHAWWPGGLVIGSALAWAFGKFGASWQGKMWIILIPVVIYGVMLFRLKFPETERVQSGVSTKGMYAEALKPLFLLWLFCMLFTGATELGTNQWIGEMMKRSGIQSGILILAWISLIMLIGRSLAGKFVHKLSPVGLLIASSVVSCIGLLLMSRVHSPVQAYLSSFVFAVGICYYWPTMLGFTSERFPRGGALLLGLMGAAGMAAAGLAQPILGEMQQKLGTSGALQAMAILPAVLVVVFGLVYLSDRAKGGYRAIRLNSEELVNTAD
ncbi:MAG: MFS transporter [Armatimonadetes bacterium]|nr:MFS transporter [Armatimonadota bacterium]